VVRNYLRMIQEEAFRCKSITERLLEYDPARMRMAYTYVDGAVMASDYFPVLSVTAAGDGTSIVEWSSHFRRLAYATDPPPPGQDDQSMTDFYNGIYKSGLESLKRAIESGQAHSDDLLRGKSVSALSFGTLPAVR
jgi:hypothetical protein